MIKLTINNKDLIFPPDLTNALKVETEERKSGDLQVVEQASDLIVLVNSRIDDLVERMDSLESGTGQEWAVPLQTETTNRILGDQTNKNLIEDYNTAQTERVDGMVEELNDNTNRLVALEALQDDYVKQEGDAFLATAVVTGDISAKSGYFLETVQANKIIQRSDIGWTRVNNMGTVDGKPAGIWLKRAGDTITLKAFIKAGATPGSNWTLCTLPDWAKFAGGLGLMYVVPAWTTQASNASNIQVHGADGNATQNIVEMLRPIANASYEFTIKWDMMADMP